MYSSVYLQDETSCCTCHEKAERAIGNKFATFGGFVSEHPVKIIILMVLVNGLLGIGMMRLESDIDVSRVYTPQGSQAEQDEGKILDIFPDTSATEFVSYQLVIQGEDVSVLVKPNIGTILDRSFLEELEKIVTRVNNTVAVLNGETLTYETVCAKNGNSCVRGGTVFFIEQFLKDVDSSSVMYPIWLQSGVPYDLEALLGNAENNGTHLTKATHLKLQFNLRSDSTAWTEKVRAWQEKFIETMKEFSNTQFDFAFAYTDSLSSELNANIGGDIIYFSVTFTLMITFACFATYPASNDCIGERTVYIYIFSKAFNLNQCVLFLYNPILQTIQTPSHYVHCSTDRNVIQIPE